MTVKKSFLFLTKIIHQPKQSNSFLAWHNGPWLTDFLQNFSCSEYLKMGRTRWKCYFCSLSPLGIDCNTGLFLRTGSIPIEHGGSESTEEARRFILSPLVIKKWSWQENYILAVHSSPSSSPSPLLIKRQSWQEKYILALHTRQSNDPDSPILPPSLAHDPGWLIKHLPLIALLLPLYYCAAPEQWRS
jgi:hypothetical protein